MTHTHESPGLSGRFTRYEGAEYENAFIPCGSKDVWSLEGGPALKELVKGYSKAAKNQYGEVMVTLRLDVTPVDKTKYPQSHYAAVAAVASVVSIGADTSCTGGS